MGVSGPQSSDRLAKQLYGVFNHAGLYLTSAGGDVLFPVLPLKVVEDGDQVPV